MGPRKGNGRDMFVSSNDNYMNSFEYKETVWYSNRNFLGCLRTCVHAIKRSLSFVKTICFLILHLTDNLTDVLVYLSFRVLVYLFMCLSIRFRPHPFR